MKVAAAHSNQTETEVEDGSDATLMAQDGEHKGRQLFAGEEEATWVAVEGEAMRLCRRAGQLQWRWCVKKLGAAAAGQCWRAAQLRWRKAAVHEGDEEATWVAVERESIATGKAAPMATGSRKREEQRQWGSEGTSSGAAKVPTAAERRQ
ncbi:hypothetical protein ACOSP7_015119 [Xanthoceras sorbifolium]